MSVVIYPRTEAEVAEIIASIRKVTEEITKDKKTARDFLYKHGFITKRGKLTKRYGG